MFMPVLLQLLGLAAVLIVVARITDKCTSAAAAAAASATGGLGIRLSALQVDVSAGTGGVQDGAL